MACRIIIRTSYSFFLRQMAASSAKRVSDLAAFCNTMCMSVIPQVLMLFFMEFTHYYDVHDLNGVDCPLKCVPIFYMWFLLSIFKPKLSRLLWSSSKGCLACIVSNHTRSILPFELHPKYLSYVETFLWVKWINRPFYRFHSFRDQEFCLWFGKVVSLAWTYQRKVRTSLRQ